MNRKIILSLFSGIGMLDSGFSKQGYCVVSAPEKILNGDIREFEGVPNVFHGVVGGSPCQSFSKLNRNPNNYSLEMLKEFLRVVSECKPNWFLLENVTGVPSVAAAPYHIQRFNLSPTDLGFAQSRKRTFQFGSLDGICLQLNHLNKFDGKIEPLALASEGQRDSKRTFEDVCKLQGFETVPDLENFNKAGMYRAVGNGVHLGVSNYLSKLIFEATHNPNPITIHNSKICACGCGQVVTERQTYYSGRCRKMIFDLKRYQSIAVAS